MKETRIKFPCGDLTLEGISTIPEGNGPFPAVVVCHPHPDHGGEMNNNVIVPICKMLGQAEIASLRFNFRGVGASQGKHADGIGEKEDVAAALSYLLTLEAIDRDRTGLCGYSFGGGVALEVAPADERVKALALISPDIATYTPLRQYSRPKLILCGGSDQFVSILALQRLAEELPPPNDFEIVAGADHFWGGFELKVATRVAAFFLKNFQPPPVQESEEQQPEIPQPPPEASPA